MTIETTICTKKETLEKLSTISKKRNTSKSAIIREIILLLSKKQVKFIKRRFSTAYQAKNMGAYNKVHIYLNESFYEHALDLRRFYRASLSLLIAEAIELLYNELLCGHSNTDNYPGLMHTMIYYETKKSMVWKHIWGEPEEREVFK